MVFLIAVASVLSAPANAGPVCDFEGIRHSAASLDYFQPTAVPPPAEDHRYGLHEADARWQITEEDQSRLLELTATIECPNVKKIKGKWYNSSANAFLIGERSDVLATNAHAVQNENGEFRKGCTYATNARPQDRKLLVLDDDHAKAGTMSPSKYNARDYVFIKLDEGVANVKPFPISDKAGSLKKDDAVFVLTQNPKLLPRDRPLLNGEPVVQECQILGTKPANLDGGLMTKSNCVAHEGSSASLMFDREDGELKIVGMVREGNIAAANGMSMNLATGIVTTGLAFDGAVLDDAQRATRKRKSPASD